MKDDIGYSIVLLSRIMGLLVLGNLNIWMVHFLKTIRTMKMPIDWATILSENLDEHLVEIKTNPKFYDFIFGISISSKDYELPKIIQEGKHVRFLCMALCGIP